MQQAAITANITNDTGLLTADQMPAFRAFLAAQGLEVRDGGAGQFFHVRWTYSGKTRWLPIERGRAGAPVTPELVRPLVIKFLSPSSPVDQFIAEASKPAALALAAIAPVNDVRPAFATPAPLSRYLSDLRDDFALHAPLVQQDKESVKAFAIRRWEYADVMLATRTPQAGD